MKRVECHKYRTPTQDNPDCAWSVGVLNLTEAEADIIRNFAEGIRSVNSPRARGFTAADMRAMSPGTDTLADLYPELNERQREVLMRAESGRKRERDPDLVALQERINAYDPTRMRDDGRPPFVPGMRIEPKEEEPEPIRNRFSGLDLG